MANANITTIQSCTLTTSDGYTYIVSNFKMAFAVNTPSHCECSIVIGKDVINGYSYSVSELLKVKSGTEVTIELFGICNGNHFGKQLFKGYVVSLTVTSSSGGGSAANLSYVVSITITHISSSLSAYTIGNRIFTKKGSTRPAFLQNVDNCALSAHDSVDTDGCKANNVSLHTIELVRKFFDFDIGQLNIGEGLPFPHIHAPDCILNLKTQSEIIQESKVRKYIQEVSLACLLQAQNGGNFLSLLTSMCSEFMLNVLPLYDGLRLSPVLPVFKFDEKRCISLPLTYITNFSKTKGTRDIFPLDAVWVPYEKHVSHTNENATSQKPHTYSPLTQRTSQPDLSYFKYPIEEVRTNGQIIEPPSIIKKLLLGESDMVEKEDPSQNKSKTTSKSGTPANKKDSRESDNLHRNIGVLAAKLLYCEYAFGQMTTSLQINVAAYVSGALDSYINKTDIGVEAPYGLVGAIIKFPVITETAELEYQIGYCRGVSMQMDQPNNQFVISLFLDHVRTVEEDNNTSLSMDEKLLYTEIKNS